MHYQATDYQRFNGVLVSLGRRVLRGEACERTVLIDAEGEETITIYKARTNFEVLKMLKVAPTEIETKVRRLSWLQQMLGDRDGNSQMIAALFGQRRVEEQPTVGVDHRLTPSANSWARRVVDDISALSSFSDGHQFDDELDDRIGLL